MVDSALSQPGPFLLEVDMLSVGNFATQFAGPPNSETKAQKATA